jgi:hypothetical protein
MNLPNLSEGLCNHNYAQRAVQFLGGLNWVEAQRWIPTGRKWCIPNCICVGPDECPCCTSDEIMGRRDAVIFW